MAIRESGVRLSVQNLNGFLSDINRAQQSVNAFGTGSKSADFGSFANGLGSSVDRELGTVRAKFTSLNSFTAGIWASMGVALGSALISGVTKAAGAIPNLIGKSFSEAINLEQASADAFAIVQPSAQQQQQLKKLAESVALNPNLQVSQSGALEAIDAALKAGISVQQLATGGIIEAIVSQQNALGGSFEENSRLIAKQLNDQAGAVTQLSAQQLANQNVGTFQAGQFRSINDLLLAQAASGGALKSLGLSQQQFNEFLSIAGTTASGGSDAGTSVKAFVNAATNASKEQASAQKILGFNIADSTGQFNDALVLSQQLSAARIEGINQIITTGGGTKEQQAALKKLYSAYNNNLTSANNLTAGITGANLSTEKRAQKIAQANSQAQAAKREFDAMLGTIPGLKQTATKIQASETEFAGLLFQAFGTDGGRFAAALAGLSEEEAARVRAIIEGADALEVAANKTNTVRAKLDAINDNFSANLNKIAEPSLEPLKNALVAIATFGKSVSPVFDAVGASLFRVVSGPLNTFTEILTNTSTLADNFLSGFSRSISLSDIISIAPGGFDISLTKDIINGGNKIAVTFGDIFSFETGAGGTVLSVKDFFTLDTTGDKVKINVKDYIEFVNSDGTTVFTIRDFITFATDSEKTIVSIKDFIEFSTNENKTVFNVGDYITFSDTIVGTKFTVDIGKFVNVSGNITPAGVFTLSLNDSNFSVDLAAVQTFVAGIPAKISETIQTALSNPGQIVFSGVLFAAGIFNTIQTALTNAFGSETFTVTIPDIASNVKTAIVNQFAEFGVDIPNIAGKIQTKISEQFANFTIEIPSFIPQLRGKINQALSGDFSGISAQGLLDIIPGVSGLTASLGALAIINWGTITAGVGGLSAGVAGLAASPLLSTALGIAALYSSINILNSIDIAKFSTLGTGISDAATGILDFGTKLVDGFDAEGFASTADTFVTSFVDRISATISGVDTGTIATSALTFATSILNKLSTVFSDPNLGADIGASAGGLVGSLVASLSNALSNPQAFADLGGGATNLAISIGGFVTSLVSSFGTELSKVDFESLVTNGVLSFGGFATGIGNAITDSLVGGIDEILGTKLASPQQRFEAFIDAVINAVNRLPGVGSLITTDSEKASAQAAAVAAANNSLGAFGAGAVSIDSVITSNEAQAAQEKAQIAQAQAAQEQAHAAQVQAEKTANSLGAFGAGAVQISDLPTLQAQQSKSWNDALLGAASALTQFATNVVARTTIVGGAGNGLGIVSVPTVRLDAGNVQVDSPKVTATGEPQVQFDPFLAVAGQPIQGPVTRQQAAQPTTGGSSLLAGVGPIPVVVQNPTAATTPTTQTAATPTGGGSGFLAPSLKSADSAVQSGVSAFSAALKAAGSSVRSSVSGVKIPPFRWPVIIAPNLNSKVSPLRWPDVQGVDLNSKVPPFPSWSAIIPSINIPSIPPFPGWGAFVQTVTVQVPSGGSSSSSGSGAPDSGTGSGPRSGGRAGATFDTASVVDQSVDNTEAIIKALTELDISGATNIKNYNIRIYNLSGGSDLLKALLSGTDVEKQAAAIEQGKELKEFSLGGSFGVANRQFPTGKTLSRSGANDSTVVNQLVTSPPQVTNNYYNTRNYNLNIYTLQSEAALTEQFAYMEHLAAAL